MIERRCNHTGSTCMHRGVVQQAYRVGPERASWRDVSEIVGGTVVFLTLFLGVPFLLWVVAL